MVFPTCASRHTWFDIPFLFVSIHPFKDGNGRAARLIHSFILLKSVYTIFAFNPEKNTSISINLRNEWSRM